MTLSALGTVAAFIVFVAGLAYFGRKADRGSQLLGLGGTLVVTIIVGWLAWYAGISTTGGS